MIPMITAPSTADVIERTGPAVLSPESQSEVNRDVDMDHGSERMRDDRRDADEAHKQRSEIDDETPVAISDPPRSIHVEQRSRTITANRVPTVTSNIRPLRIHRNRKQGDELLAPNTEEVDFSGNDTSWMHDYGLAGLSYEYCQTRLTPSTPSSYLRPGSKFSGMQKSERSRYDVEVEIKQVDLRESFLCGYLRIQGT